ncbi:MAG: hypothetical protein V1909_01375 [Candidatus Micrarchaeota archaeon]
MTKQKKAKVPAKRMPLKKALAKKRAIAPAEKPTETKASELLAPNGLKNLMSEVNPESMGTFSTLYLDPVEGGFKVTIWSGKKGLIEGFVSDIEMPPLVRKILVKRTESLEPGDCIELIGKRENDIALIASEPIDHPRVSGTLVADVNAKDNGEIHLKITLLREHAHAKMEHAPGEADVNIEHLTEIFNKDITENMGAPEFEMKASELIGDLWDVERLVNAPKEKKTIASVCKAAESLSKLSKKYGFTKISQLSESVAILFEAYLEKGTADSSSLPIVIQTVGMLEKMVGELSQGPGVDYLVSQISRKDSAS